MTDTMTESILGAALEVHKVLSPGLLESAYEECLATEFDLRGLRYQRQLSVPLEYKDRKVDAAYRIDFLIENAVVMELKSIEKLEPIYDAQVITYLKLLENYSRAPHQF
jgi:GxxExxY protein